MADVPADYPHDFEESLSPSIGLRLTYREWRPEGAVRGGVLLCHGFGEHLGRYGRLARGLNAAGYLAGGVDHRGMGLSAGERMFVRDYGEYVNDLEAAGARMRQSLPEGVPLFVYGHSMGGLIALRHAQAAQAADYAGTILSGPLIGSPMRPARWQVELGKLVVRVKPGFRVPVPINAEALTSDEGEKRALLSDPLILRHTTLIWFFATECAMRAAREAMGVRWPTLWLIAGLDSLCDPAVSRAVFDALPTSGQHIWQSYPRFLHELHNERPDARAQVLADVLAWLDATGLHTETGNTKK